MGLLSRLRSWHHRQHAKPCHSNNNHIKPTSPTNTITSSHSDPSIALPQTIFSPPTQTVISPSLSSVVSLPSPATSPCLAPSSPSHVPTNHVHAPLPPGCESITASPSSTTQVEIVEEQDDRIQFRPVKEERTCVIQAQHGTNNTTTDTQTPIAASIIQVITAATTTTTIPSKSLPTLVTIDITPPADETARARSISLRSPSSTQLYDHDPITPSHSCITSKYHQDEEKLTKSPSTMSKRSPPTLSPRMLPLSAHPSVYAALSSSLSRLSPLDYEDFPPYTPPLYSTANYDMPWMDVSYSPSSYHDDPQFTYAPHTHGLSRRNIATLSSYIYTQQDECEACTICLTNFHHGDMIRSLVCSHSFHITCIDPWLSSHARCPNCNVEIMGQHKPITSMPKDSTITTNVTPFAITSV